ncbi:MAG: MarR family winged helix-turn-helix transcriptional regulator [Vulcanimicrobiaceae bacterium]
MIAIRKTDEAERIEALEAERAGNLRQLFLGASRALNRLVVEALQKRGHKKFRSTHLSLTSNIDLHGTRLNVLAARANMTKQAMWELANELEKAGYVKRRVDVNDRRNRIIAFTDAGWQLKMDNIEVFREIEAELSEIVGKRSYDALRGTLRAISGLGEE